MALLQGKRNYSTVICVFLFLFNVHLSLEAQAYEYTENHLYSNSHENLHFQLLQRHRRDVPPAPPTDVSHQVAADAAHEAVNNTQDSQASGQVDPSVKRPIKTIFGSPNTYDTVPSSSQAVSTTTQPANVLNSTISNDTPGHSVTASNATAAPTSLAPPNATVSQSIPNVGVNGTGTRKNVTGNLPPKVSEPIADDDEALNVTDFEQQPEKLKEAHNITDLTYDHHLFYNTTFIGDPEFFKQHWENINTPKQEIHPLLSNSHRKASTHNLAFPFPFYGLPLSKITVATGGFIFTGEHVHSWLAATQYIAPLMANFDTSLKNDSVVKISDDGTKFTVIWENVALQESPDEEFTFACTLYKSGDIVFAYKTVPIPVQDVKDVNHPVKIGISDAYLNDRIIFYLRRKTIYEYHRVNFMDHNITNGTILKLSALPTCLQFDNCQACTNHNTSFACAWCPQTQRCSSGTDRKKQDWFIRNCDKTAITTDTLCAGAPINSTNGTSYIAGSDKNHPYSDPVIRTGDSKPKVNQNVTVTGSSEAHNQATQESHTHLGGVFAAFLTIVVLASVAAWILYAFKNPHTKSGQLLIKYRPSQWSWKRGEARYTAATIHM